MEKYKVIQLLQKAISGLNEDSAYIKLIDLTQKLFYKHDRVVIVVSPDEARELRGHPDFSFFDGVAKSVVTPHGVVDYIIVDNVPEMHGYTR